MGTNPKDDEPFRFLTSFRIRLRVSELRHIHFWLGINFIRSSMQTKSKVSQSNDRREKDSEGRARGLIWELPMTNKEWFPSPFECHILPFGDISQFDLNLGQSQNVRSSTHTSKQFMNHGLPSIGWSHHPGCNQHNTINIPSIKYYNGGVRPWLGYGNWTLKRRWEFRSFDNESRSWAAERGGWRRFLIWTSENGFFPAEKERLKGPHFEMRNANLTRTLTMESY